MWDGWDIVEKTIRIIQTTLEYTIPENLVRIGPVVSENEKWIKKKIF